MNSRLRDRRTDKGERIRGSGVNVGRLRYARAVDHSLADWWYAQEAGVLQLRLPWPMLNVSDPSSRQVLFESDPLQATGPSPGSPPGHGPNGRPRRGTST